jgi:hypothetical protein
MGKALDAYRRYRDLAARGAFDRLTEVLDEGWVENCLGLTGWNLVRLRLLGQAPDLPATPTRRAVQVELAQH